MTIASSKFCLGMNKEIFYVESDNRTISKLTPKEK